VRALLVEVPDMPATVLAERVGWTGSIRWFSENVRRLRPEHRPDRPGGPAHVDPGDAAQCDLWFPPRKIPLEDGTTKLLPVLVITCGAFAVHDRTDDPDAQDRGPAAGLVGADPAAGRVPRRLIWDNEPGIGRGPRRAEGVAAFMGTLATKLVLLPPRTLSPRAWSNGATAGSRPPSCPVDTFTSPADFNTQFTDWLDQANARTVRTIKAAPSDLIDADRAAMLPLPPIPARPGGHRDHALPAPQMRNARAVARALRR
jgi:hypothetical protein